MDEQVEDTPKATSEIVEPTSDELRDYAGEFRRLAEAFTTAAQSGVSPKELRWVLCLDLGFHAGMLLHRCLDRNVFAAFFDDPPGWDLRRGNAANCRLLALMALSYPGPQLAIFDAAGVWSPLWLDDSQYESAPMETAEDELDGLTPGELRERDEERRRRFEKINERIERHARDPEEDAKRNAAGAILSWLVAIRWWLIPEARQVFGADAMSVFHPRVDKLLPHEEQVRRGIAMSGDDDCAYPRRDDSSDTDAYVTFLLQQQAEIQERACRLLANWIEEEADTIAELLQEDAEAASPTVLDTSRGEDSQPTNAVEVPATTSPASNRMGTRALCPTVGDETIGTVNVDSHLGSRKLAEIFSVPPEPLRNRLKRWRAKNKEGWIEDTEHKPRDPKYLYRVGAVRHIVEGMKATSETTGERPAKRI